MSRKSPVAPAAALPADAPPKRRGRSGEGTASLLAQLNDDQQRVDAMVCGARPTEPPGTEPDHSSNRDDAEPQL